MLARSLFTKVTCVFDNIVRWYANTGTDTRLLLYYVPYGKSYMLLRNTLGILLLVISLGKI